MQKKEDEKEQVQEIELDDLEQVTGGSLADAPRVPVHPIDDKLKEKV
jgi:hypothetical protein